MYTFIQKIKGLLQCFRGDHALMLLSTINKGDHKEVHAQCFFCKEHFEEEVYK